MAVCEDVAYLDIYFNSLPTLAFLCKRIHSKSWFVNLYLFKLGVQRFASQDSISIKMEQKASIHRFPNPEKCSAR
jgi:hypothetical protein